MNCDETRRRLAAHLDEELDLVHDQEIVTHLDGCPACSDAALAHAARRGLVREKLPRFTSPPGLEDAVRTAIRSAKPRPAIALSGFLRLLLPLAACIALAGIGGYGLGFERATRNAAIASLVSSHVHALMSDHAVDVVSTSQHTVKPWFAGKLDFTPPVPNLETAGFPLVGGRLDHLAGRTVAAIVYRRRQHVIDVYAAPAAGVLPAADTLHDGYNIVVWTEGEIRYAAVSDLAESELRDMIRLWRNEAAR